MQALVLAGGEGTRLRPLTLAVAKPVMPLAGRPFLTFMLDWLRRHGVDDVLLSCGYRSHDVEDVLGDEHRGMRLRYVIEDEPLGTAGPLRLAADEGLLERRVLVLNGDCLTDIDLTAELRQHEGTGAVATLALIAVDDTSSYGVVPTNEDGEVEAFLEKSPGPAPTNRINAGAYVLEREVIDGIPGGRAVSIEREIFPELVGHGLYGFLSDDYWIDIGTPERYLEATYDLLAGRVESDLPRRDETSSLIYDGCITSGARIGPLSVLGRHCSVGDGSNIERSVLHDNVVVGHDCDVVEAVLAEGVRLEDGARVEPGAIVGSGATVSAGAVVPMGTKLEPQARVGMSAGTLSRDAIAAVDLQDMLGDVLSQPHQLGDAVWRAESARIERRDMKGGLVVCGMGGSAVGAELAAAAAQDRAHRPIRAVRDYALDPWTDEHTLALCASYSGNTEEALSCFEDAGARGIPRVAVTTGGELAERARSEGVPVIGVPAGFQPRAAVIYMTVCALEVASFCGAAPSLRAEIEGAAALLEGLAEEWGPDAPDDSLAKSLARRLHGSIPVIYGGGGTAAPAGRWKTQVNENAKLPAFSGTLPEADHNEVCGYERPLAPVAAVFLEDESQHERVRRRIDVTARLVDLSGAAVERVEARGANPVERVLSLVLLGDLVSVYLAALDGVDPTPVEAIDRLKAELGSR